MSAVVELASSYSHQSFKNRDFSGLKLKSRDLSHSVFQNCKFNGADLTEADCSHSRFIACDFTDSILYRANFKDSQLVGSIFRPKDCYGITFTFECRTFENVLIGQLWWFMWLVLCATMTPETLPVKEPLHDKLLGLIGAERYVKLKNLLKREF